MLMGPIKIFIFIFITTNKACAFSTSVCSVDGILTKIFDLAPSLLLLLSDALN